MIVKIESDGVYSRSNDVAFREVEGEVIIVPANQGTSAEQDVLFTLTGTGKLIWDLLDGTHTVTQVIDQVLENYDASESAVAHDVVAFLEELVVHGMIVD